MFSLREKANLKMIQELYEKKRLKRLVQFVFGCFIISLAYNIFIVPNNLVAGGIGGVAVIINHLFGISNSTFILKTYRIIRWHII